MYFFSHKFSNTTLLRVYHLLSILSAGIMHDITYQAGRSGIRLRSGKFYFNLLFFEFDIAKLSDTRLEQTAVPLVRSPPPSPPRDAGAKRKIKVCGEIVKN